MLPWPTAEIRQLSLESLDERYRRYRLEDRSAERAMRRSLERYGQMSPIVVCVLLERPVLVDGFKRLSGARSLKGFTSLAARVLEVEEAGAKAAIYTLNRIGRPPQELEEAWIVHALVREDGLSQVEAGALLGRHKSWVNRRLAMWERLAAPAKDELRLGLLSPSMARQFYSRRQYLCFTEQQDMEATLRQHVRAFEHLGGVAASCLYDNMKVVVQCWEDDQPIYNTRFLAFATHYGFRPQACRPRRPQTKGKVERPFHYVETNLLNGREFRSLEHLNEVTRWWLENVADVRMHRETKKRPVDAHAEELPHLIPLPAHAYDTAQVIYRVVSVEGRIDYRQNHYSVPWNLIGQVVPVRISEDELLVYNAAVEVIARHKLWPRECRGQQRIDPAHRPSRSQHVQIEELKRRFAELGGMAGRFLEGLLSRQRYSKHQALRVLGLLRTWRRDDVLAAMERAVRYHAYSLSSLERILAVQARPRAPWEILPEEQQQRLCDLAQGEPLTPRSPGEYQGLLFGEETADDGTSPGATPPEASHDNPRPEPDSPDEPPSEP